MARGAVIGVNISLLWLAYFMWVFNPCRLSIIMKEETSTSMLDAASPTVRDAPSRSTSMEGVKVLVVRQALAVSSYEVCLSY